MCFITRLSGTEALSETGPSDSETFFFRFIVGKFRLLFPFHSSFSSLLTDADCTFLYFFPFIYNTSRSGLISERSIWFRRLSFTRRHILESNLGCSPESHGLSFAFEMPLATVDTSVLVFSPAWDDLFSAVTDPTLMASK